MKKYKTLAGLLAKPERWTIGWRAKNSDGIPCEPTSPNAVCWCLVGGGAAVLPEMYEGAVARLVGDAIAAEFPEFRLSYGVGNWNDSPHRTHADVLRVASRFDKLVKARSAK